MFRHVPPKGLKHTFKMLMPTIGIAPHLYGFFRVEKHGGIIVPCLIDPDTFVGGSPPDCVLMRLEDVAHAPTSQSMSGNHREVEPLPIGEQLRTPGKSSDT